MQDTAKQLDQAMRYHDLGAFYRGVRELVQAFTPQQGKKRFLDIGGQPNKVELAVLEKAGAGARQGDQEPPW